MGVLGNENYIKVATQMAIACGVELSYWTRDLEHVCTADKVGNIIETYATLLVKNGGWDEMCSLLRYLAFQDEGGLALIVAGHRVGAVCDQAAPPPGPPPSVEHPAGAPLDTAPAPGVHTPAVGAGQPPSVMGGSATALRTGDRGHPPAGPPVRGSFGKPPRKDYVLGSFTSCDKDPEAWRCWPVWQGDLRPLRFTAVGMDPEILDAFSDDVAELNADLASPLVSAIVFDSKHRNRVARVWAAEVPEQADLNRAQLGVGRGPTGVLRRVVGGSCAMGRLIGPRIRGLPRSPKLLPSVTVRAAPAPGHKSVWPKRLLLLLLLRRTASVDPPARAQQVPLAPVSQVVWRLASESAGLASGAAAPPAGRAGPPLTALCPRAGTTTPRAPPRSRPARAVRRTI